MRTGKSGRSAWQLEWLAGLAAAVLAIAAGGKVQAATELPLPPQRWILNTGDEFPGARGSLETIGQGVRVESDFSGGGNYIGVFQLLPDKGSAAGLAFDISTPAGVILVEATDAGGRNFFQTVQLSGDSEEVQHVVCGQLTGSAEEGFGRWGGPDGDSEADPVRKITIRWIAAHQKALKTFTTELTNLKLRYRGDAPLPAVLPADPAGLVVPPGTENIALKLEYPVEAAALDYQLTGYDGGVLGSGRAELRDGQYFTLPLPAETGFFEFVFPVLDQRVGALVLAEFEGERDSFFAVDGAFSVFQPFRDNSRVEAYLKLLRYSGIGTIRDRLTWQSLEGEGPGEFDWELKRNAATIRRLAAQYGIEVLDSFHDAPLWTGAVRDRSLPEYAPYPRDLIRTAESWRQIGEYYRNCWTALEVWNEPEISFGAGLPGDQPMTLLRVLAWEFAVNKIGVPLIAGAFTGSVTHRDMMRLYLENGLLDNAEAVSFHDYNLPEKLEGKIREYRDVFQGHSGSDLPLWITECGRPWPVGTARALPADDRFSAMCIAMKATEARAGGVARFFPFVLPYYEESANNFGMFDRFDTPMRSFAAYANVVRQLAGKRYAGDLPGVEGARLSRVFVDGDDAVIVLYTDKEDVMVKLPADLPIEVVSGADGRRIATERSWRGGDGIWFVTAARTAVEPWLQSETPMMELRKIADGYEPVARQVHPVVLQYDFDREATSWNLNGYQFEDQRRIVLPICFNNLSEETMVVQPALQLPPQAVVLEALPEQIEIGPRRRMEYALVLDLDAALKAEPLCEVVIRDENRRAEPLEIGIAAWKREILEAAAGLLPDNFDFTGNLPDAVVLEGTECWEKWDGAFLPNIRAEFLIRYSPEKLQIVVRVEDKEYNQPYPLAQAWRADSVQVALQTRAPGHRPGQNFTELGAACCDGEPGVYLYGLEDSARRPGGRLTESRLQWLRTGQGYVYNIELDAAELGLPVLEPGTRLGMALIVNSSAGVDRDGYLYWGDGIGKNKNPRAFNLLELSEKQSEK